MVVSGACDRQAQKILIIVHGLDYGAKEEKELRVFKRCVAGGEQVYARVGGHGPVVVLAAAVHAGKGLFVKEAYQPVAGGDLLHDLHGQLVVVGGDIGGGVDRRQFVLGGCHLIVLGFGQDAQFPELLVQIGHIGGHAGFDNAEIVVVQLLTLRRLGAEERAAGEHEVLALFVHFFIDQEIFLFRPD